MNDSLKYYELPLHISNVLIVGDNNYYSDTNVDVEIIAKDKVASQRYLSIDDYINTKKRPLYYKYNNIIIEENYLDILASIKYYFNDKDFTLIIIVQIDYKIEENDDIISFFENPNFKSNIKETVNHLIIKIQR